MKTPFIFVCLILVVFNSCQQETADVSSLIDYQGEENYSVIFGSAIVGHLNTQISGDTIRIDYDYKNNGRGPTMKETLVLNAAGFPVEWHITGHTTFGNAVD